ncbi:D-alanine--D-alanine ligase, partial [bacterium]|nr:D-alanine--D-alanine ligase [bacterium]
ENDPSAICLAMGLKPARLEKGLLNGEKIDVVFPIIHGTYGEDGCLQGFLQMQHIPFVGSGVLGSAVGMDKDIMKRLLKLDGIKCAKHQTIYSWQEKKPGYDEIVAALGEVLFIKPCNLGSSIGISKVKNRDEYEKAISFALQFDTKILVEEYVEGREIEVSVLGNENAEVSIPGEIIPGGDFYSYNSKYIDSNTTELKIPAQLKPGIVKELREIAKKAFHLLELSGLSRVDFFVKEDDSIWLNEVNTLPGFTNISMYPKLWETSGIPYPELIHRLIQLAIKRFDSEKILKRNRC